MMAKKLAPKPANKIEEVNEFLDKLKHPFKAEVQAVRDIIKGIHKNITEQIKWNVPSFSYKGGYTATFNLHAQGRVHLAFHNPAIAKVKSEILEGNYPDRRMVYFADMNAVKAKKNVLQAARAAGVRRLVFTSSVAALGVSETGALLDETHPFNYPPERWPYGYAKHLAEGEVRAAANAGLDCVIVNPALIFGPGDLNLVASDLIVGMARRRVPVTLPGGINVVHVADVAAGHLAAAERGRTGERYILGGENLTHVETLRTVAEELGLRPPQLLPPAPVGTAAGVVDLVKRVVRLPYNGDLLRLGRYFFYCDTAKARRELGLGEPRPARQAIREAVAWYREHGYIT